MIDRQVAAYNNQDIEAFIACYADDATIIQTDGSVLAVGREQIRAIYAGLFEQSPDLRAEIRNRIEVGPIVMDEEFVTGLVFPGLPPEVHGAVVYRVDDGLIQEVHLYG
ncbi:MAG TPA: SgcJ/EcaC family oxidoreductase [Acidimicrobiales bacterium]|nr:SgcJ/EcaC family oxidoreductase [Acidimicrobiales bacterium]